MRLLFYAMGGGLGHLSRSLSLARAAALRGHSCRVLCNSPWAWHISAAQQKPVPIPDLVRIRRLDCTLGANAVRRAVVAELQAVSPDCLIVDSFPRGIGGELVTLLASIRCRKVLVSRLLNPEYVRRYRLRDFVSAYDLVVYPGEVGIVAKAALHTSPWLSCESHELMGRSPARQLFGIRMDTPLVLVAGSGKLAESAEAGLLAAQLARRMGTSVEVRFACLASCFTPAIERLRVDVFPLLPLLPAADLVIGSAGYNTVHETRAAGVRLLAQPQFRMYDLQHGRLAAREQLPKNAHIVQRCREILESPAPQAVPYVNGVHAALDAIEVGGA